MAVNGKQAAERGSGWDSEAYMGECSKYQSKYDRSVRCGFGIMFLTVQLALAQDFEATRV